MRKVSTDDEEALFKAAEEGDVRTLTSLLQKGVCPNVHDRVMSQKEVNWSRDIRERNFTSLC